MEEGGWRFFLGGGYKVMCGVPDRFGLRACFPDSLVNGAKRVNSSVGPQRRILRRAGRALLSRYTMWRICQFLLHNTRHFHTALARERFLVEKDFFKLFKKYTLPKIHYQVVGAKIDNYQFPSSDRSQISSSCQSDNKVGPCLCAQDSFPPQNFLVFHPTCAAATRAQELARLQQRSCTFCRINIF